MEELFKNITDQLVIINSFFKLKVLTQKDIKEEQQNYNNFVDRIKELNLLLETMRYPSVTYFDQLALIKF